MQGDQRHLHQGVAEVVQPLAALAGFGLDRGLVKVRDLPGQRARRDMQQLVRHHHRFGVGVVGLVQDVVLHARAYIAEVWRFSSLTWLKNLRLSASEKRTDASVHCPSSTPRRLLPCTRSRVGSIEAMEA